MFRMEKKIKFLRGEYRQKWDMPHKIKKEYNRNNLKKDLEEEIQDYELYKKEYFPEEEN